MAVDNWKDIAARAGALAPKQVPVLLTPEEQAVQDAKLKAARIEMVKDGVHENVPFDDVPQRKFNGWAVVPRSE